MKDNAIKMTITIKSVLVVVILSSFFGINLYFSKQKTSLDRQERQAKSELYNLESKLSSFKDKAENITDALKVWEQLSAVEGSFAGLKISVARNILNELKEEYDFADMSIEMSKPEILSGKYKTQYMQVESSNVTINFRSLTDIEALYFISDLMFRFPGYFKINSYNIQQERRIDDNFLDRLGNAEKVTSVFVKIECSWRGLKEI